MISDIFELEEGQKTRMDKIDNSMKLVENIN